MHRCSNFISLMKFIGTSEGLAWVPRERLKQAAEAPACISEQGLYRGAVGPAQKGRRRGLLLLPHPHRARCIQRPQGSGTWKWLMHLSQVESESARPLKSSGKEPAPSREQRSGGREAGTASLPDGASSSPSSAGVPAFHSERERQWALVRYVVKGLGIMFGCSKASRSGRIIG